jgi:hypothetical protein
MAIPNDQLETWTGIGAVVNSTKTYNSVKAALEGMHLPNSKRANIYLQGSYRNKTNIRGDSDVDVVVCLRDTWNRDLSALNAADRERYVRWATEASYTWEHFRDAVHKAMIAYFGKERVTFGTKAIAVQTPYLKADVIAAIEYRKYESFSEAPGHYIEGISLHPKDAQGAVASYPGLHIDNCEWKNSEDETNGWFKPVVRMMKNARGAAIDRGYLAAENAPSCFVECLVYNMPKACFDGNYGQMYCNVVNWANAVGTGGLLFAHGQRALIGTGYGQFTQEQFAALIGGYTRLWSEW